MRQGNAPGIDPAILLAQFLGLGILQLQALVPNRMPCYCGKCQGVKVRLEAEFHFDANGGVHGMLRSDAPKPDGAPADAPKPE
jgi:hypothetical protein